MTEELNPFSLHGKRILITGASSGIGRQCAIQCSLMGAKVILIGRNNDRLEETLHLLSGKGHGSLIMDLNDINSSFVKDLVSEYGIFDGFIHSAGIEKTLPVKNLKTSDYEEVMKINAFSAFEIIKQLSSKKHLNDGGSIILISSITSLIARGGVCAYSASKGAINSAVRVIAIELSKRKIRVNSISPGTILTSMMRNYLNNLSEEEQKKRIAGFPLGLGNPEDIANGCVFLLSDASRWVTGTNLVIDGGYTAM